jgi:hypothetical protein
MGAFVKALFSVGFKSGDCGGSGRLERIGVSADDSGDELVESGHRGTKGW